MSADVAAAPTSFVTSRRITVPPRPTATQFDPSRRTSVQVEPPRPTPTPVEPPRRTAVQFDPHRPPVPEGTYYRSVATVTGAERPDEPSPSEPMEDVEETSPTRPSFEPAPPAPTQEEEDEAEYEPRPASPPPAEPVRPATAAPLAPVRPATAAPLPPPPARPATPARVELELSTPMEDVQAAPAPAYVEPPRPAPMSVPRLHPPRPPFRPGPSSAAVLLVQPPRHLVPPSVRRVEEPLRTEADGEPQSPLYLGPSKDQWPAGGRPVPRPPSPPKFQPTTRVEEDKTPVQTLTQTLAASALTQPYAYYLQLKQERKEERKWAIANNLVQDPDRPRALKDAITFVGTCEDMCSRYERMERIVERGVHACEKAPGPHGVDQPSHRRMVKRFGRSAAGADAPLPSDVRSPAALLRTVYYLMDEVVGGDKPFRKTHAFVWDRTRAVRRDFTLQNAEELPTEDLVRAIEAFEVIARFHVQALHTMADPEARAADFSAHNEREQLDKTLYSLMQFYDICHHRNERCAHEAEFRVLYILRNLQDAKVAELIMALRESRPELMEDPKLQAAADLQGLGSGSRLDQGPLAPPCTLKVVQANFADFFRVVASPRVSYAAACVAEGQFDFVRRHALHAMRRAYRFKPTREDVTLEHLVGMLGFDDPVQARRFIGSTGMSLVDRARDGKVVLVLTSGPDELNRPRDVRPQMFSRRVERKAHGRPLSSLVRGQSVREYAATLWQIGTELEQQVLRETRLTPAVPSVPPPPMEMEVEMEVEMEIGREAVPATVFSSAVPAPDGVSSAPAREPATVPAIAPATVLSSAVPAPDGVSSVPASEPATVPATALPTPTPPSAPPTPAPTPAPIPTSTPTAPATSPMTLPATAPVPQAATAPATALSSAVPAPDGVSSVPASEPATEPATALAIGPATVPTAVPAPDRVSSVPAFVPATAPSTEPATVRAIGSSTVPGPALPSAAPSSFPSRSRPTSPTPMDEALAFRRRRLMLRFGARWKRHVVVLRTRRLALAQRRGYQDYLAGLERTAKRKRDEEPEPNERSVRRRTSSPAPETETETTTPIAPTVQRRLQSSLLRSRRGETTRSELWRLRSAGLELLPNGIVQPVNMPLGLAALTSPSRKRSRDDDDDDDDVDDVDDKDAAPEPAPKSRKIVASSSHARPPPPPPLRFSRRLAARAQVPHNAGVEASNISLIRHMLNQDRENKRRRQPPRNVGPRPPSLS
ncbi:MAG: hypothetical protein M1826_003175 [Phylliscum demangeonii]|nr:MAG: hypothetical protein M1826_003175 [Phylliscum demangeonii]